MLPLTGVAQTEAEIKEKAEQLFLKEQYVEATPLFLRLLSLQPRDFDYNFKYGTCLLFNSNKKQDAIRYLSYATKDATSDPRAFFFLGKAYHLNYQFNDAIREYQTYQSKAGTKGTYSQEAARNMEMCRNGKKLLSTITEIIVTKKTEIKNEDFFRIYDLSNIGGSIVVAKDFQSKNDKKYNHIPIVHFPQGTDKIVYSSYGENDQKDIYMVRRLPDGKFSLPQLVQGNVNTSFDEDYPYIHPSGEFMYFSSKGHNSMGGYDVFRSKYDAESNSYGVAENIDFAISSPDDDILYMVDKDDKNAYFASARQSQDGKLYVYQVMVDRVPIQLAIVKGMFNSSINPDNKKMSVEVIDKLTDKSIGVFKTSPDGGYLITFPKGGKYEYQLTIEGNPDKFISSVEIPYLKEFKPLKQKVVHEQTEDGEVVRVVNLFNEEVEDAQSIIAQVLKERSDLNVNVNQFNLEELNALQEEKKVIAELGLGEMSLFEVGELLQQKSNQLGIETTSISNEKSASNAFIVKTVEEIKKIDTEIKALVSEADQSESDKVQHSILKEAQMLIVERNEKVESMNTIQSVHSKLEADALSETDKKQFAAVSKEITTLIETGNESEALKLMKSNSPIISNVIRGKENGYEVQLLSKIEAIDTKLKGLDQNEITFSKDIELLEAEIRSLTEEKGNVKEKFQAEIQSKIDFKQQQLTDFKEQREALRIKQAELSKERKSYVDELEMIRDLKNYKGVNVSNQTAENSKKSLSTENANTLAQYVDNQLEELVSNNPELANGTGVLSQTSKIIEEHNVKAEEILGNSTLTEIQKNNELIALNISTSDELDVRLTDLKTEIEQDRFNDLLRKELKSLEAFSSRLQSETNELKNGKAIETNEQITYSTEKMEDELFPTYSTSKKNIEKNDELSAKEKLEQLNATDEEYQSLVNQELMSVNEQLAKSPNDAVLKSKKETLTAQEKVLKKEIEERIAELNEISTIEANETQATTKATLITEIDPTYSQKIEVINSNSELSTVEKINNLQSIDNEFLAKAKNELEAVENAIERAPTNQSLIAEKQLLEELIEEKSLVIESRASELAQLNEQNETPISKEALKVEITNRVSSSHQTMVASIENSTLSEEQKNKELNEIHSQFLKGLEKELAETSNELDANPSNENLINEVAVLQEMVDNQKAIVADLKEKSTTTDTVEAPISKEALKVEITNRVSSSHQTMVVSIENSTLSEEQKNKELNEIHSQFLKGLEKELAETSNELDANPSNENLINEMAVLQEMVDNQKAIVADLKEKSTTTDIVETPLSKEELVAAIDPAYTKDIEEIEQLPSEQKFEALIEREEELQSKLNESRKELNQKAENSSLSSIEMRQLEYLNEAIQASENRVEATIKEKSIFENSQANESFVSVVDTIRNEILSEDPTALTATYTSLEELKKQDELLANYESKIVEVITTKNNEFKNAASKKEKDLFKQQVVVLEEELRKVKQKRRSVSVSIGEIETSVISPIASVEKVESLQAEELQLKMQLNDAQLSSSERKTLEEELSDVKEERLTLENPILKNQIDARNSQIEQLISSSSNDSATQQLEEIQTKVDELTKQAENQKSEQSKNYLLKEVEILQQQAVEEYITNAVEKRSNEVAISAGLEELSTQEELETKKRQYSVEIGSITQSLNALKNERASAKSKEKTLLNGQISSLETRLAFLEKELEKVELRLTKFEVVAPVITKESLNTEITFEEEFEMASSENYTHYAKAVADALEIENQLLSLEEKLNEEKKVVNDLIADEVVNQTNHSKEIQQRTERIRTFSVEIGELQTQLEQQKALVNQHTPTNETERMKFENLVLRGINPLKKALIATALIPLPANGIEINSNGVEATYSTSNPIPVNVEAPSGLVYRVQVGAFARPIPQDLFKEFTPVSGEKIANSNITRYMAGYFNNSQKVVDAREQIKALGYSDAFIVAYCDGKRISFGEARNLESSGQCIPKGSEDLLIEVAENTALNLGLVDDTTKSKPVSEYSYNQAPGAAKAEAIEQIKGLFFTVQIGVYNKPVSSGHFLNIEPLNTIRLPNGQIRYSTGVYRDYNAAMNKQNFVRSRGIVDAFVTAYYNSERITLKEAQALLAEKGETILTATKNGATTTPKTEDIVVKNSKQIEVFENNSAPVVRKLEAIQIVTKKSFAEYPRDVLNRYNAKGSFYFDTKDGKVKSVIYDSHDKLPHIHGFKDDIDTVYHQQSFVKESGKGKWVVKTNSEKISGDFADWLLKLNYRRDILQTENGLEIHIFDVPSENVERLSVQLSDFKLLLEARNEELD